MTTPNLLRNQSYSHRGIYLLSLVAFLLIAGTQPAQAQGSNVMRSAYFDGSGSYYRVNHNAALHPATAITIEAWVRRDLADRCETVVSKNIQTSYWLGFCNDTIRFYTAGAGTSVDGATPIPAGEWTHIAVTFDGTTRRYYINGELDLEQETPGALGVNTQDLTLGVDFTLDDNPAFYFQGHLDEVRLWSVARTQDEIVESMFRHQIYGEPGLIAAWSLDANGRSQTGTTQDAIGIDVMHTYRGVLPRAVSIFQSPGPVTVDGLCNSVEYGAAERVQAGFATVSMHHDADDLYICFGGLENGADHAAIVAFDSDYSRTDPAGADDYRFSIDFAGTTAAEQGNGAGGYTTRTAPGDWAAAHNVSGDLNWSAEFRFSREDLDLPTASPVFGLKLTEDRGETSATWPVGAQIATPSTWGRTALIDSSPFLTRTFTITGHVRHADDDRALAGATVRLFASSVWGTSLVDTVVTASDGAYAFSYSGYPPGSFIVQEEDPPGYHSTSATAGEDGDVRTSNVLIYPGNDAPPSYSAGIFYDRNGPAFAAFDRHYLIVYGEPVSEGDLWPLIRQKQMQGFQVHTISVEQLDLDVAGRDRAERIRNWLRQHWVTVEPAPVYALLVGTTEVIPARQIGWEGDKAHRPPEADGGYRSPAIPIDWYYADLDSNWDSDNDGWYGEYLFCEPGKDEVPVVAWPAKSPERDPCPPSGSPLRESPTGTSADIDDDWVPEISIGRLMVGAPTQVRTAVQTMVEAEAGGSADKHHALLAGSFWSFDGRSWKDGEYLEGNERGSDFWTATRWDDVQPYGDDTARFLDDTLRPAIEPYLSTVTRLYETTHPLTGQSPTAKTADMPISHDNVELQWETQPLGLVNIVGHGFASGIVSVSWLHDYDQPGVINQPADPATCSEERGCWELRGYDLIDKQMPDPANTAPVVFANACSTGDVWRFEWRGSGDGRYAVYFPGNEPIAAKLPADGKVSAWIGGLGIVPVHALDGFEANFNQDIVEHNLRLGDAFWRHMRGLAGLDSDANAGDWRRLNLSLFGDPARAYWGNSADTVAPWPQAGRDWFGSSHTGYSGPIAGRVYWTRPDFVASPPVVDRDGNIVVGGNGRVWQFTPRGNVANDELVDGVPPGLEHTFSPALASDAIYIASATQLYVLNLDLSLRERIALNGDVTGAPKVGPDGAIWVPTDDGVKHVFPSGHVETLGAGIAATGRVAFMRNGDVIWTASGGRFYRYYVEQYGSGNLFSSLIDDTEFHPPTVGPDDEIYLTDSDGFVRRLTDWSFDLGAPVTAPPTLGPDGTVYAVNERGEIRALRDGGTVWLFAVSNPIPAAPAVDNSHIYFTTDRYLYRLDATTGEFLQRVDLGASVDERSTPVIGLNQMLYVRRADNKLVAVGPHGALLPPGTVRALTDAPNLFPGEIVLEWQDNSEDEESFNIELCEVTGVCQEWTAVPANTESTVVSQLPTDRYVYLRVQAVGTQPFVASVATNGVPVSGYGMSDLIAPRPAIPVSPDGLLVMADSAESLVLTWDYAEEADVQLAAFDIYRRQGDVGDFVLVGSVSPGARDFRDAGLDPATGYSYRVGARNAGGTSDLSSPAEATTLPLSLALPSNVTVDQDGCTMIIRWQDNANGETAYQIERRLQGEATYVPLATTPADRESYTDTTHLLFDDLVAYRVKAIAATGESVYAATSVRWSTACAATSEGDTSSQYLPLIVQ